MREKNLTRKTQYGAAAPQNGRQAGEILLTTLDTDIDPADQTDHAVPPQDSSEPRADDASEARAKLIAEARKYRKRAQEAERQVAELEMRLLDDEQHSAELTAAAARADRLTEMLSQAVISDRLKTALASRGVKHVSQAARLLAEKLQVRVTDGEYAVQVAGLDDAPEGEVTVEGMVDDWLADNPHYLPPSGDTGSGAYPGVTAPKGASIEQLDLNPARKAEFVARYGPAALVQLARAGRKPGRR